LRGCDLFFQASLASHFLSDLYRSQTRTPWDFDLFIGHWCLSFFDGYSTHWFLLWSSSLEWLIVPIDECNLGMSK